MQVLKLQLDHIFAVIVVETRYIFFHFFFFFTLIDYAIKYKKKIKSENYKTKIWNAHFQLF